MGKAEQVSQTEHPSPTAQESDLDGDATIIYVRGLRYWGIGIVIASMMFLATMDMTIAATSILAITDDLGHFDSASWILTSYFLGYVGVIVILAKLSDIVGRKSVTVSSIVTFTLFSAGCASAQTMTQLIVLRAFQGVGAGGSFALASVLLIESEPPEKYADAVSRYGVAIVLALVLGPVLGGAISEHTMWRWIFLINIPIGVIAIVVALLAIPTSFPFQDRPMRQKKAQGHLKAIWERIDGPGTILILLATISFTACFQEVGSRFSWDSAYTITLIVVSVLLWILLLAWERRVTLAEKLREPILPWRFFTTRETVGLFVAIIFVGAPVAVTNFQLPQRFMLVNGLPNFGAAVRVIPFGGSSAIGTILSGKLASKLRVPGIYLVLFGAALQIIGFALLGTLDENEVLEAKIYGYQVIAGMGCAFSFSNLIMLVAFTAEKRDGAVALGVANQFRAMGSAIGLAVVTSVFNGYVRSRLDALGFHDGLAVLHSQALVSVTQAQRNDIRAILSQGFNKQMLTLCAFGAAQIPAAWLMWRKKQVVVAK